jgi:SAM-dependent methyltransferase
MGIEDAEERIEGVFRAKSNAELLENYGGWCGRYDADMQSLGYRNPAIISALLARCVTDQHAAILDAGAGTGLVGELLAILGYDNLTALDLSPAMLDLARGKAIYRNLIKGALGQPLAFADSQFTAVACAGTFTAGHAPPDAFDELLRSRCPAGSWSLPSARRPTSRAAFGKDCRSWSDRAAGIRSTAPSFTARCRSASRKPPPRPARSSIARHRVDWRIPEVHLRTWVGKALETGRSIPPCPRSNVAAP